MPGKKKPASEAKTELPSIPKELIDQFVKGPMSAEAIQDASMAFKKALIERALGAELGHHLGYPQGAERPEESSNQRNGKSSKTVLTDDGPLRLDIPRDRDGSFAPILIPKHERRFTGFDDKIIAMYARGMTVREIRAFLSEQYGTDVSHDFISSVTDAVLEEVTAWQQRPLEPMYPVIFFDALRVKIREEGLVRNKAIYLALGVLPDGTRDILGIWIENTEGAKFWMKVFNDLKTRGVEDVLIAVTDGLKGMPEALSAVFPTTTLQTCIVHLIRNSLDYAAWDKRRELAKALKPVYQALNVEAAEQALDAFEAGPWGKQYPTVVAAWRRAWDRVIPFFVFPPAIRKVIYTTNAIESINAQLRKIIKTRGHFPTDDAATKLIWLALQNITSNWGSAVHDWKTAMNQFAILYGGRLYAIHKPHLPYGRGMKSGIRVGSMLHLSSYPKQSVGYLSTALQPFSRQPNRFVLVHRIADETMFMQSAHGLEVEPFPSIAVIKTEGYQQGKHGFFNQFIVVFHDRCSARSLNSP